MLGSKMASLFPQYRKDDDFEFGFYYLPEVGVEVSSLFNERGRGDEFKEGGADLRDVHLRVNHHVERKWPETKYVQEI